ncbi:DUF1902 domain-containing protein [Stenotrophomonas sp. SORGH_AS_0321]|uniref:DUF1902 domain-containing protein n=1 Tax=Stenotrophomonas sp. SORGH_AS_0321 TaxID=3041787 RepID=UPI002864F833|nr:DUF1902 domain-containing protein [Stenotrophomonas sp. SORGH_AS_0321]MDR6093165.1 hypothetical protein [Stenotrophomonas sp. SORGH_AS_0321]
MRPNQLLLRCFAERDDGLWVAHCLDLSLAVQGDSLDEVKRKLDLQIRDYVQDALVGEDREHAGYLLKRKAPLSLWVRYYWICLLLAKDSLFHAERQAREKVFSEPMPMQFAKC